MVRLVTAIEKDRDLLWNINQKYLYEMTNYYDDTMDEHGNYHYGHFEEYFSDPKRTAYLLYDEDTLIGFAMIKKALITQWQNLLSFLHIAENILLLML